MQAISSLRYSELFNLHRLLRKKSVENAVQASKIILLIIMIGASVLLISEGIENKIATATTIAAMETEAVAALATANETSNKKVRRRDYDLIARSNLFGALNETQQIKNIAPPLKPVAKTALTLVGTFIVDGQPSSAIIEDQKKKQQDVFAVGETIFDDAKLVSVSVDRIKIERAGQIEELVMDDSVNDRSSSSGEFKDGVAILNDSEVLVQEAELDKALENLPLLLTQARAVPYFKDGKSIGLRLFAVKSGSLFERLGLRNGDILKTINGNSMGDLSQAIKLFETLKQERNINITMERDRAEKEVRFQIK